MIYNYIIAGVGGQGTVLASKLIAVAAMSRGFGVRTTETIGMAQRGGSVFGHVRIGDGSFSPMAPPGKAHAIIGFEPAEAARQLGYLSEKGTLIVCDGAVIPVADAKSANPYDASAVMEFILTKRADAVVISGRPIREYFAKALNVALLGAAARCGIFPFETEALIEAISEMKRYREENLNSFELGRRLYDEYAGNH